jgi:pimeloyl-ACP methyl ester carboxylesterase
LDVQPRRHRLRHSSVDVWSAGEGPPLILLHGWGLSARPYRPAIQALAGLGYRVVAPSVSVVDGGWTMQRLTNVAADALFAMDVAEAVTVGHSFGGALGLRLAVDHPDLVRSLILVDSFAVSPGRRALVRIALPGAHWRVGMSGPTALALAASATREGGLRSLARSARWVLRRSMDEEAAAIRDRAVPAAVLWAERDTLLPLSLGQRTAEALGASLEVIPTHPPGWTSPRWPDHDWPTRGPAFFADRLDATVRRLDRS